MITPAGARPHIPYEIHKHQLTAGWIKKEENLHSVWDQTSGQRAAKQESERDGGKERGLGAKKKRKLTKQALIKTVRHL